MSYLLLHNKLPLEHGSLFASFQCCKCLRYQNSVDSLSTHGINSYYVSLKDEKKTSLSTLARLCPPGLRATLHMPVSDRDVLRVFPLSSGSPFITGCVG